MLQTGRSGGYVLTGVWAEKAFEEAQRIGNAHIVASSKADGYRHIPLRSDFAIDSAAAYLHITSNNTIYGTQWHDLPLHETVPLVIDASSDIASRRLDVRNVGMIYAGAQKNLGPSGVTVVILRNDFLAQMHDQAPLILRYKTLVQINSL
jgi:phosphoserine aminotransferase